MDSLPDVSFHMRIAKLSDNVTHISKHMHVAIAEPYATYTVHFL